MSEVTESRAQPAARAGALAELGGIRAKKPRSLWSDAFRQFRRHRLAMAGMIVLAILVLATVLGPPIYGKSATDFDATASLQGPSLSHPMGTDDLGHDIFARILWGGRISLAVGVVAMLVGVTLGTIIGALSGFFGRFVDSLLMRITDLFISLPDLPLLLLVTYLFRDPMKARFGVLGGTFVLIVLVIGGLAWMPVARLVRASFLSVKEKEFIEAARCIGASTPSLIV
ncbi:MAG: ABC transporter permease, partial [Thermomicrobiaceae bacterium]|nr:ABC transporter permease [Thermomicrobiaceae bacterium]